MHGFRRNSLGSRSKSRAAGKLVATPRVSYLDRATHRDVSNLLHCARTRSSPPRNGVRLLEAVKFSKRLQHVEDQDYPAPQLPLPAPRLVVLSWVPNAHSRASLLPQLECASLYPRPAGGSIPTIHAGRPVSTPWGVHQPFEAAWGARATRRVRASLHAPSSSRTHLCPASRTRTMKRDAYLPRQLEEATNGFEPSGRRNRCS